MTIKAWESLRNRCATCARTALIGGTVVVALIVVSILISIMAAFAARELLGRINEGFCRSRRSVIQERLGAS